MFIHGKMVNYMAMQSSLSEIPDFLAALLEDLHHTDSDTLPG